MVRLDIKIVFGRAAIVNNDGFKVVGAAGRDNSWRGRSWGGVGSDDGEER